MSAAITAPVRAFFSRIAFAPLVMGLVAPLAFNPLSVSSPVVPEALRPGVRYIEVPALAHTGRVGCTEDLPAPAIEAVPAAGVCLAE